VVRPRSKKASYKLNQQVAAIVSRLNEKYSTFMRGLVYYFYRHRTTH